MSGWLDQLRARVESTSIAHVARELGYSRTALSLVLSGKYLGDTKRMEQRAAETFNERHHCPFLEREISGAECRLIARKPFNSSSPLAARQWRTCRSCPHNPVLKKSHPKEVQS